MLFFVNKLNKRTKDILQEKKKKDLLPSKLQPLTQTLYNQMHIWSASKTAILHKTIKQGRNPPCDIGYIQINRTPKETFGYPIICTTTKNMDTH